MENFYEYNFNKVAYEYESYPFIKKEVKTVYLRKNYNDNKKHFTKKDYEILEALYHELMPSIINLQLHLDRIEGISETKLIKWPKIAIFSLYFLSWCFVLMISYAFYRIPLNAPLGFLKNITEYINVIEDPFSEIYKEDLLRNNIMSMKVTLYIVIKFLYYILGKTLRVTLKILKGLKDNMEDNPFE